MRRGEIRCSCMIRKIAAIVVELWSSLSCAWWILWIFQTATSADQKVVVFGAIRLVLLSSC